MENEKEIVRANRMHFYMKSGDKFPRTWAHCDKAKASEFRPECIIVEKVFNECSVVECPVIVRFTEIPADVGNVSDCRVINVFAFGEIIDEDIVQFTVEFTLRITFDNHVRTETFQFTKRIRLEGADPDLFDSSNLDFIPFAQCLNCRLLDIVGPGGKQTIECEVGLFVVVKLKAFVQLEVKEARFCPLPPECEQISPIGCPEFLQMVERGDFWPPFPPQPDMKR